MLHAVEEHALAEGCCRVTLEVLEHNPARRLYEALGYAQLAYGGDAGGALFYVKPLG